MTPLWKGLLVAGSSLGGVTRDFTSTIYTDQPEHHTYWSFVSRSLLVCSSVQSNTRIMQVW